MKLVLNGQIVEFNGPRGLPGPDGNPIGTVIAYMGLTAPDEYLICDGSVYNISDYSDLATFFETNYGSKGFFGGDGTSTFAVPDMRNLFLRGCHGEAEEALSGDLGAKQDATEIPGMFTNPATTSANFGAFSRSTESTRTHIIAKNLDKITKDATVFTHIGSSWYNNISDFGSENPAALYTTRPVNMAVTYCIKATKPGLVAAEKIYSTEEQKIGTWIDADGIEKPVYKKTFAIPGPISIGGRTYVTIGHGLNLDKVFDYSGTVYVDDGSYGALDINSAFVSVSANDFNFIIYNNYSSSGKNFYNFLITAEYTKKSTSAVATT